MNFNYDHYYFIVTFQFFDIPYLRSHILYVQNVKRTTMHREMIS